MWLVLLSVKVTVSIVLVATRSVNDDGVHQYRVASTSTVLARQIVLYTLRGRVLTRNMTPTAHPRGRQCVGFAATNEITCNKEEFCIRVGTVSNLSVL